MGRVAVVSGGPEEWTDGGELRALLLGRHGLGAHAWRGAVRLDVMRRGAVRCGAVQPLMHLPRTPQSRLSKYNREC